MFYDADCGDTYSAWPFEVCGVPQTRCGGYDNSVCDWRIYGPGELKETQHFLVEVLDEGDIANQSDKGQALKSIGRQS